MSMFSAFAASGETQEIVLVPKIQWNQALEKLKSCEIKDVDLDVTATPFGFQCEDWMIYADDQEINKISLLEIDGIQYLPE